MMQDSERANDDEYTSDDNCYESCGCGTQHSLSNCFRASQELAKTEKLELQAPALTDFPSVKIRIFFGAGREQAIQECPQPTANAEQPRQDF